MCSHRGKKWAGTGEECLSNAKSVWFLHVFMNQLHERWKCFLLSLHFSLWNSSGKVMKFKTLFSQILDICTSNPWHFCKWSSMNKSYFNSDHYNQLIDSFHSQTEFYWPIDSQGHLGDAGIQILVNVSMEKISE